MNASEMRALERLEADTIYLARLIERTMVEDAQCLADGEFLNEARQLQSGLFTIRERARKALRVSSGMVQS